MQLAAKDLGTAEEDARLGWGMKLADRAKDHVPIGAAEVSGRAEPRDGVVVRVGVVDLDVDGVGEFNFGGEVLVFIIKSWRLLVVDGFGGGKELEKRKRRGERGGQLTV